MRVPLPNIHKRKGLMSTLTSHAHSVRLAFHSLREAGATWRNTAAKAHSAAVYGNIVSIRIYSPLGSSKRVLNDPRTIYRPINTSGIEFRRQNRASVASLR